MLTDKEMLDTIKKRTLDRIPFSYGVPTETSWITSVTVDQYINHMAGELSTRIRFELPGTVDVGYMFRPKTWWDAFKHAHFPAWLIRLFPIAYEKIHVRNIYHLYPQKQFGRGVVVGRD